MPKGFSVAMVIAGAALVACGSATPSASPATLECRIARSVVALRSDSQGLAAAVAARHDDVASKWASRLWNDVDSLLAMIDEIKPQNDLARRIGSWALVVGSNVGYPTGPAAVPDESIARLAGQGAARSADEVLALLPPDRLVDCAHASPGATR